MFFNKKSKKETETCPECKSKLDEDYSFCPYCGSNRLDMEKEIRDFGMLGRNNRIDNELMRKEATDTNLGITDKIFMSVFNNLMKNLDKQLSGQFNDMENAKITNLPNGIKISIGSRPAKRRTSRTNQQRPIITAEQMEKINTFPRTAAKTNIRRLSDKVVYELNTPGLQSPKDVFVSKIESGYEIKAIGDKKIYINSLPINLPIAGFVIENNKLFVEFLISNIEEQ